MAVKQQIRLAGRETPVESLTFRRFRMIPVIVEATQLQTDFILDSPGGDAVQGYPGDWLVKRDDGMMHVCTSEVFYVTFDTVTRPEVLGPLQ